MNRIAVPIRMSENSPLAELLRRHKAATQFGDAKLARLCCEFADDPLFVHRSNIRNWATGQSRSAQNWRQIATLATVLGLDRDQANELLDAAGCSSLDQVQRALKPEDARFIAHWPSPAAPEPTVDHPPRPKYEEELRSLAPDVSDQSTTPRHQSDLEDAWFDGAQSQAQPKQLPIRTIAAVIGVLALLIVGGFAALGLRNNASESPQTTGDEKANGEQPNGSASPNDSPVSNISSPSPGYLSSSQLIFAGQSTSEVGVNDVFITINDMSRDQYWSEQDQKWQGTYDKEKHQFPLSVSEVGGTDVSWSYQLPVELEPGRYRARVWSRRTDLINNELDGQLVEFVYLSDDPETTGATAPIESMITAPSEGDSIGVDQDQVESLIVEGKTSSNIGVDRIEAMIFDPDRRQYWNPDGASWQDMFVGFEIPIDENQNLVSWQYQLTDLEPGSYSLSVRGANATGIEQKGPTISFTVE